jgi:hypothetical protein
LSSGGRSNKLWLMRRTCGHPLCGPSVGRLALAAAAFVFLWTASGGAEDRRPTGEQIEFFERKIRPVLVERCYKCHSGSAKEIKGGLRLDTREAMRAGGETGPAITAGDPDESLLLAAIRYDGLEMPPDGRLPDVVVRDFETWIRSGAADPRDAAAESAKPGGIDIQAGKRHWAFQPPRPQSLPEARSRGWGSHRSDEFVFVRLKTASLEPNIAAERNILLRRASIDLVGLPPTPDDVARFAADAAPDAYERALDRLLTSVQFGERWARLWLDVARYGEDQAHIVGKDRSLCYPNAYLYRDWVIRALNDDLPYDRFVEYQLAADVIPWADARHRAALGFLGLGPKYYGRNSPTVMADEWEDRVDTVSRGLLGLTVACARCHDHKFDPIRTEDYYALAGVFASTEMFNRPLDERRGRRDNGQAKMPEDAIHVVREGKTTDLAVFIRGSAENKGPVVPRRFVSVLDGERARPFSHGSGRHELALAVTRRDNPLTARVLVNRVWGAMFGRPIVVTPSNFGTLGERPTHPELLDDLAVRFVDSGWSLKWLVRELASSATYRQSSRADAGGVAADPENRLLGRMSRRRLSVEAWRDSVLASGGNLDTRVGGPSIDPLDVKQARRTIYSEVSRLELNRMLALFDYPDPNIHADRRVETTTPLQKLFVLNSPLMIEQAYRLAARLANEIPLGDGQAPRRRIERAYELLYCRQPRGAEVEVGLAYLTDATGADRWPQYVHVLLAANEMLFVD